jgi:hypothetical protein
MTETQDKRTESLPHDPYGHGHSVAAWTATALVCLGSLIMSVAVIIATVWIFVVGAVVAVLSVPASMLLTAMGLGSQHRNTR